MLQSFLGSFMLSQLYTATLKRSAIKEKDRKPFFVYMDEAFRYMPADFEEALVISRKYNVGLHIFHQFVSQFDHVKNEALAGVGTNIIFQVGINDARILAPILQAKFTPEDIVDLKPYECIARIGSDVVKFNTNPPLRAVDTSVSGKIIQESYKKYYKPVAEVKASLLRRHTNILYGGSHDLSKKNGTVKNFMKKEIIK